MSKAMNHLPIHVAPIKPLQDWLGQRTLPESHGGDFRKWIKARKMGWFHTLIENKRERGRPARIFKNPRYLW